jgi:hypothetical protein
MCDEYIIECPHCNGGVCVKKTELNCKIFRHGVWRHNGRQLDPHSSKQICDHLASTGQIYGCGMPFRFDGKTVEKCGYI